MKKLLGILVLVLFFNNNAIANLIELDKCFHPSKPDIIWTMENYEKETQIAIVPKDLLLKNYKKWGMHTKLKKDHIKDSVDNKIDEFDYVYIHNPYRYGEENINNLKSIGAKFFSMYEKSVYSIDTKGGIITEIAIKTDEYVKENKDTIKYGKQFKGDFEAFGFLAKKTRVSKYAIDSYAGGIIVAYFAPNDDFGYALKNKEDPLVIDLNKNSISSQRSTWSYDQLCADKSDQVNEIAGSSGTAFFISRKGHLLTNNHVVEGCKLSKINYFNKEYDTNLISTDKTLDLALLKVDLKPRAFISFSNKEPKKRQLVIVAGYPLGEYLSDDLKINEGKISSLKGFDNNSNEITVDLAINPGNSGGPIVNEKGQLVAVAVAGMSKEVTEGISFGIKSSAVTNFLKTNKISPDIKLTSFSMNDEKVNQLLEESTVYIFCE